VNGTGDGEWIGTGDGEWIGAGDNKCICADDGKQQVQLMGTVNGIEAMQWAQVLGAGAVCLTVPHQMHRYKISVA